MVHLRNSTTGGVMAALGHIIISTVVARSRHRYAGCVAEAVGGPHGSAGDTEGPPPIGDGPSCSADDLVGASQPMSTIAATGPPPSGPWWAAETETKTAGSPVTAAVTPPTQALI